MSVKEKSDEKQLAEQLEQGEKAVYLTKRVKMRALKKAPYHKEGQIFECGEVLAEQFIEAKFAEIAGDDEEVSATVNLGETK